MTSSSNAYLLLDDFDEPEAHQAPEPSPEPEIILPTDPAEDLRQARSEAFANGHRQGLADAGASRSEDVARAVRTVAAKLEDASVRAVESAEKSAEALLKLFVEILAAGYPSLRVRYGVQEIGRLARAVVPALARETQVVVEVHPTLALLVAADLAGHPRITVTATETVPPGDASISWKDGGAIRDTAQAWSAVVEVLGPLGLLPETVPAADAANL